MSAELPSPIPSDEVMAHAYAVLTQNQAVDRDSIEHTAEGCEQMIAQMRDGALKAHAASVSAADEVLRVSQHAREAKQRLRIRIDYSLALVVLFVRGQHANGDYFASASRAVAKRHWCARFPPRTARCDGVRKSRPIVSFGAGH